MSSKKRLALSWVRLVPSEKMMLPLVKEVAPVPPLATVRVPVVSFTMSIDWPRLVRQVPPTAKQPVVTLIPFPEKVEVAAEVFKIEPPVMVRPLVDDSPPALVEDTPPAKVEVALLPEIVVVAVPPT